MAAGEPPRTRPPAFVFTSPDGGQLRHRNFYGRFFKQAVLRAELDTRTRYSTIQVTADRCGHLFPSLEAALTARLDESYRAAKSTFERSAT